MRGLLELVGHARYPGEVSVAGYTPGGYIPQATVSGVRTAGRRPRAPLCEGALALASGPGRDRCCPSGRVAVRAAAATQEAGRPSRPTVASTRVVCDGPAEQRALNVEAATA